MKERRRGRGWRNREIGRRRGRRRKGT